MFQGCPITIAVILYDKIYLIPRKGRCIFDCIGIYLKHYSNRFLALSISSIFSTPSFLFCRNSSFSQDLSYGFSVYLKVFFFLKFFLHMPVIESLIFACCKILHLLFVRFADFACMVIVPVSINNNVPVWFFICLFPI